MHTLRVIFRTFRKYRWHVVALALLGFVSAILEGVGINIAIPLLSFFMGAGNMGPANTITHLVQLLFTVLHLPFTFRYLLAFILALFIARAVFVVAFGYIRGKISANFMSDESKEVLGLMLRASWPYLLAQKIGHLHSALMRDLQRTTALLEAISQGIQSWTGFCMYLLVAFTISPLMTLATLGGGGAVFFVARPILRKTQATGRQMAATEKTMSQFISEHIIGMKMLKASGTENRALESGTGIIDELRVLLTRLAFARSLSSSLFQPFSLVFVIVLFAITYRAPGFSIVTFAAELYLIQKIFTYLESGQAALQGVSELVAYAESVARYKEVLREHREEKTAGGKPFRFEHVLAFEHVSLSYGEGKPVLADVSFNIRRGETVGIIGPSGAGKTSLVDLMLRLFEPGAGEILLDGVPARDIALEAWRSHIGYVSQDVFLFNTTIEENIRLYRSDISKDDIIAAAKRAHAYDFIMALPDGFDSSVGDRGVTLSGGQRQRIALARALAGNPELLVLDEATSALDSESERLIQQSIAEVHGEITVVMIAHRLSTIENADRLLVVDHGRVVEQGTPEELLRNPESYYAKTVGTRR